MTSTRWQKIKAILADALEEPNAKARAAFIEQSCAGDAELFREVEAFLAQESDNLETYANRIAQTETTGRIVGSYELLRELGRGGMGTVWLARRAHGGFQQTVAIKLLKRGTDTDEVLRRFQAEREILARLQHPNIARLLDGGTTDDGLPYFVMEYVEGAPLTHSVATSALSLTKKLELFLKICGAVQFAHQNLIVHRDLKPENILVTSAVEPKLLDFGIARLLEENDAWRATVAGRERLTPAYASPEQVRGEPVTTASDIYTLGALLYEVLVGKPAHNFSSSHPTSTELSRVICETEVMRPSLAAEGREARLLRGDLDNIVQRAMAKSPSRRYASADHLADDLRRYLEARPVRARPDTFSYRSARFVQRNKVGVTVASVLLLTLLGGIVATTLQRNRAQEQRARAEAGEQKSRRLLYAAQLNRAYQAWDNADAGRALDLLEASRPAAGQEDLRGFEWYLLSQLAHEPGVLLQGSSAFLFSMALSRDGQLFAAVNLDGRAFVWNSRSSQPISSFDVGGTQIAFAPDSQVVITGDTHGLISFWQHATGQLVRRLSHNTSAVTAIALAPDKLTIAVGHEDGVAEIWNPANGELVATLQGHSSKVFSVTYSPDSLSLVTTSTDHTARLWELATGKEVAVLTGHTWWVLDAAFTPDGRTVATTGSDGEVKLWDVATHREVGVLHGDGVTIRAIMFSPDGSRLAVGKANAVLLYDAATHQLLHTYSGHGGNVLHVAFSPDNKTLFACAGTTARLWELNQSSSPRSLIGHKDWVWSLAFSPDGRTLASASKDASVKIWDTNTGRSLTTLSHPLWVNSVAYSPDGSYLATAGDDKAIRLWNPTTGEALGILGRHDTIPECVVFSPDSNYLASSSKNGEIKLWEVAQRKEIASLRAPASDLVWSLAFSPDGKILAAGEGAADGAPRAHSVFLWDVATRKVLCRLDGHSNDVRAVAFSPDGKVLASGGFDGAIRLWNVKEQRQVALLQSERVVNTVAFSPDGKRLISAGSDKRISVWDLKSLQELCTIAQESDIMSVAIAPNNQAMAAGMIDGVVKLWAAPVTNE